MKKPLIIITGPTAVGKSKTAVKLARKINGSIISADSMQVYKGLDIGSAKVTAEEMEGIKHYLIDVLEPTQEFHVVAFKEMAKAAIEEIYAKGKIPIVTGGTGFYIQALLYDVDFTETAEDKRGRENFREYAEKYGNGALHDLLKEVDPKAAQEIHENNVKRVIRALEYYYETGTPISKHNEEQKNNESPYDFEYFVLTDDRAKLYKRINARVDEMFEAGLEAEVRGLYDSGLRAENISMLGIGYREFFPYFEGKCSIGEVRENIKKDTRHFAKKQLTWFKRERDVRWIDIAEFKRDTGHIAAYIAEKAKKDGITG